MFKVKGLIVLNCDVIKLMSRYTCIEIWFTLISYMLVYLYNVHARLIDWMPLWGIATFTGGKISQSM